jgi:hypothetical protein
MAQNLKESIFSQLLLKTLDTNPDNDTAAQSILRYLQDSRISSISGGSGDLDYDRFQKSYQKVIQDNKIFGHKISQSSSQDLSLQLLNEFTTRYVTAKELQQKYLYLESDAPTEQKLFQEYSLLLIKEKNIKQSLQKLYEVRSHDISLQEIHRMPMEERITLFRRKYRVSYATRHHINSSFPSLSLLLGN